jgi:hypothetical protein
MELLKAGRPRAKGEELRGLSLPPLPWRNRIRIRPQSAFRLARFTLELLERSVVR